MPSPAKDYSDILLRILRNTDIVPCYAFVTTFTDGSSVRAERTKKGNDTFTVIGVPK